MSSSRQETPANADRQRLPSPSLYTSYWNDLCSDTLCLMLQVELIRRSRSLAMDGDVWNARKDLMVCTWYILFDGTDHGFPILCAFLAASSVVMDRLSLVLWYMRERFAHCVHLRNVIMWLRLDLISIQCSLLKCSYALTASHLMFIQTIHLTYPQYHVPFP
jgi:hypothetical protein